MSKQKTIINPVTLQAKGLFSGQPCRIQMLPGEPGSGVVWLRNDLEHPARILTDISNLGKRNRRTSLINGKAGIETVEHVLSAVVGMDIDNLVIEIDAEETPSVDGSPLPFVQAIENAGVQEQDAAREELIITEPIHVSSGSSMLAALPGPTDCLEIMFELDYSEMSQSVGKQVFSFTLGKDDYSKILAPARTFLLHEEAIAFQEQGLGKHLTTKEMLVMGDAGPVDNVLRFPDEHVRHKICDLIGDLALLGRRICGRVVACRAGHDLNHELVKKLAEFIEVKKQAQALKDEPLMDIRRIMRLLPHRYPFLMVDRLVSVDGDKHAVGIKNVTINEPFFQGHYPNMPIMPGVMILEAMAQLSGILLSRRLEHTGKIAVLLSMDRVKMRRPVKPGDQLMLHAEALHVRSRTGHCRCKAMVDSELAAEAEIKFMLVDAEPV